MVSKKELADANKKAEQYSTSQIKKDDIDQIWNTIKEMQENLKFINDKLERVISRMGLQYWLKTKNPQ